MLRFLNPFYFILLAALPLVIFYHRKNVSCGLQFSELGITRGLVSTFRIKLIGKRPWLRAVALLFLIAALSRPQLALWDSQEKRRGIDIVMAMDISTSMLAEDFVINGKRFSRLDIVKSVSEEFISARKNDRVGLVAFASRAYTVSPLTLDHEWLIENMRRVKVGLIEDGTAVGSAIVFAINRLRNSQAVSKVVILLTDGVNNAGKITPVSAAETARAFNIRIYCIGIGSQGLVPYPVKASGEKKEYVPLKIDFDEQTLKKISALTRAKYFKASDLDSLNSVFAQINTLEKSTIEEKGYREYVELYPLVMAIGIILLSLEILLSVTLLHKIP